MHLRDRINNGMLFYEHGHKNPIDIEQELLLEKERIHCKEILFNYNNTPPSKDALRKQIMKQLLGSCGEHFFFEPPVHMSYGSHVHIGNNVWIGAHSVVLPGVTIGDNTVIGAGSIVTRDIPANVVAVGNPCRVMREISERDKDYYFRDLKVDYPYVLEKA